MTLCGSELQSQLGTLKHAQTMIKLARGQGEFTRLIQNFSHYPNNTLLQVFVKRFYAKETFQVNLPLNILYDMGAYKDDFIVDCKFRHRDCLNNFSLLQDFRFLNCYTFRTTGNFKMKKGPEQGLSLILKGTDIPAQAYYNIASNIANTKGIRVVIHEPDTIPDMITDAFEIMPGHSTSVSMVQKNMKRISTPNSKCDYHGFGNVFGQKIKRRQETCLQDCLVNHILHKCDCITMDGAESEALRRNTDPSKFCYFTNMSDISTSTEKGLCEVSQIIYVDNDIEECQDECHWDCEETLYEYSISTSSWPMDSTIRSIGTSNLGFIDTFVLNKPETIFYKQYWKRMNQTYSLTKGEFRKEKELLFLDIADIFYAAVLGSEEDGKRLEELSKNNTFSFSINPSLLNLSNSEEAEKKWISETFFRLNIYFRRTQVETHTQVWILKLFSAIRS